MRSDDDNYPCGMVIDREKTLRIKRNLYFGVGNCKKTDRSLACSSGIESATAHQRVTGSFTTVRKLCRAVQLGVHWTLKSG